MQNDMGSSGQSNLTVKRIFFRPQTFWCWLGTEKLQNSRCHV